MRTRTQTCCWKCKHFSKDRECAVDRSEVCPDKPHKDNCNPCAECASFEPKHPIPTMRKAFENATGKISTMRKVPNSYGWHMFKAGVRYGKELGR